MRPYHGRCRIDTKDQIGNEQDESSISIPPEDLRGATITLSNFGMIGGRFASLVVVPPQVAIVGAGPIAP